MTNESPESGKSLRSLFVKNTMWNTAGVSVYLLCQWLITIIVVWQYGNYVNAGYLSLAAGISGFFYCVASCNMRPFQSSDATGEYSDSNYVSSRVLTCAVSIVLCAIFVFSLNYSTVQRSAIMLYMLFRAIEAFADVMHGIDQKHWRMDYIGISFISRGVLMLGSFVLLGWLYGFLPSLAGLVVTSAAIAFFYDLPKVRGLAKFSINIGKPVLLLLKRSFPLMIVGLAGVFIIAFTRISVESIHGTEALGAYSTVAVPAMIIQAVAMFLLNPLINIFTIYFKESNKRQFLKLFMIAFTAIIGITVVFSAVAVVIGQWGLTILFSTSIVPYAYLLPGALIGAGLTVMIWFLTMILSITRNVRSLLFSGLIGAVTVVSTTGLFLVEYGLEGANITMIVSQSAAVLFMLVSFFAISRKIWIKKPEDAEQQTN